jgi:hypothetical protein
MSTLKYEEGGGYGVLMPLSTIFQLYRGDQFYLIILFGTVQTQIYILTVNLQSFKYIDFYIISEENVTKINISQRCYIKNC